MHLVDALVGLEYRMSIGFNSSVNIVGDLGKNIRIQTYSAEQRVLMGSHV